MFIKCIKCLNEYKTELRRSNTYIYVPYRVREEARKLGAQFDPELKLASEQVKLRLFRTFKIIHVKIEDEEYSTEFEGVLLKGDYPIN